MKIEVNSNSLQQSQNLKINILNGGGGWLGGGGVVGGWVGFFFL